MHKVNNYRPRELFTARSFKGFIFKGFSKV